MFVSAPTPKKTGEYRRIFNAVRTLPELDWVILERGLITGANVCVCKREDSAPCLSSFTRITYYIVESLQSPLNLNFVNWIPMSVSARLSLLSLFFFSRTGWLAGWFRLSCYHLVSPFISRLQRTDTFLCPFKTAKGTRTLVVVIVVGPTDYWMDGWMDVGTLFLFVPILSFGSYDHSQRIIHANIPTWQNNDARSWEGTKNLNCCCEWGMILSSLWL